MRISLGDGATDLEAYYATVVLNVARFSPNWVEPYTQL